VLTSSDLQQRKQRTSVWKSIGYHTCTTDYLNCIQTVLFSGC